MISFLKSLVFSPEVVPETVELKETVPEETIKETEPEEQTFKEIKEEAKLKSQVFSYISKELEERHTKLQKISDETETIFKEMKIKIMNQLESKPNKKLLKKYQELNEMEQTDYMSNVLDKLEDENLFQFDKVRELTDEEKEIIKKIKIIFKEEKSIYHKDPVTEEDKLYASPYELVNDYIIGEYENRVNFINGRANEIKKFYKKLPVLEKALEKEIKSDVSEMTKARISGIVGYIKSGQLRAEVIMPMIVLIIGLLGTDFFKSILVKMGFKPDESDRLAQSIEKLSKKVEEKQQPPAPAPVVQPAPSQPINIVLPDVDKLKKMKAYSIGL